MPYEEPFEKLSPETLEARRARRSLREELEAIDWYQERIDVTQDAELEKILEHNRDEEKEHAAMLVEWLRKHDRTFNRMFEEHD